MSKEKIFALLSAQAGDFVSGEDISAQLGISRAAVWKAVGALRRDGYTIEAQTGLGYRLADSPDVLSERELRRRLGETKIVGRTLECFESVDSTNSFLKRAAAEGAPDGAVAVADEQTAGRGRRGRSFSSGPGRGVYLSALLRPQLAPEKILPLTALGAVITSLITGYDWQVAGATYVNFAMFFAFATLYPDAQVLLFFFIPVKIKWMAILDACYFAYIIFFCAASRYWIGVVLPLVALLNFFVFFAPEIGRFAKREQTRTKQAAHFHNAVRQTQREQQSQGYRHKCAVCGRTDVTNPELQFRYCSKCAGYHCFCQDHINNHIHFTE